MIRAVLKEGLIYPLDPIPGDWSDGQELRVDGAPLESNPSPQEIDEWYEELQRLGSIDPAEREQIDAILREADEQAKRFVRRDMGLE